MANILVIDAEPTVREIMTSILKRSGHSVSATGDFNEAMKIANDRQPDLILTNVFLNGIAGHDAMFQIKAKFPSLPVLMVSGLPDDNVITEWRDKTGFDVFPKPFTHDALTRKVREVLVRDQNTAAVKTE